MVATDWRHMLCEASGGLIMAPGAFDGLSARLVEQAGFQALYASGGAIARSMGVPDIGLLSVTEVSDRLRQMSAVTSIPIVADADTGYGNANNVHRAVHLFEQAGVSAMHLEDQIFPKRCGHMERKALVEQGEMLEKIHAAISARTNANTLIIARTDAIAVEGFESALRRAEAYAQAGADMLFVEAPETVEQIQSIPSALKSPCVINMFEGGKTPLVDTQQLETWGYRLVIIPSDTQRAAIHGMQMTLESIKRTGNSHQVRDRLVSFSAREAVVNDPKYVF